MGGNPDEFKGLISKLVKEAGKGYLLEVDVSYHDNLHILHKDLSSMSEKMKINEVQKLVPNLFNKKKYVIHITTLDQMLNMSWSWMRFIEQLSLTKAHGWHNAQLRTRVKNNFEKNFFKLMNNSVFGKMMENVRKHIEISIS